MVEGCFAVLLAATRLSAATSYTTSTAAALDYSIASTARSPRFLTGPMAARRRTRLVFLDIGERICCNGVGGWRRQARRPDLPRNGSKVVLNAIGAASGTGCNG